MWTSASIFGLFTCCSLRSKFSTFVYSIVIISIRINSKRNYRIKWKNTLEQGHRNLGRQVAVATKFRRVMPHTSDLGMEHVSCHSPGAQEFEVTLNY